MTLDGAHLTRVVSLVTALPLRERGTRPRDEPRPLPPGRYRLRIDAQINDGPWSPIERVFVARSEARANIDALISRMTTAIAEDCTPPAKHVADALADSASPEQLEPLLSLDRGRADDRAEVWMSLAVLPEVQARLRERLFHRASGLVAATVILRQRALFDGAAFAEAESALARGLPTADDVGTTAIFAVNRSSWSRGIVEALTVRIDRISDAAELGRWDNAFTCVDPRIESMALGELARAFRGAAARIRRTSPDVQRILLRRADELVRRIRAERRVIDRALSIAGGGRRPGPNAGVAHGCGFGFGASRHDGPHCSRAPWPTPSEVAFSPTTIVVEDAATAR